jgi:hypothetical protein
MKRNRLLHCIANCLPALLLFSLERGALGQANEAATEFPAVVQFELGAAEFFPGDNITIESVRGTSSTIRTGETYCVEGTYTLASLKAATLALFATTKSSVATQTDPSQILHIEKGSGRFRLVKKMREEGWLHVSFYPAPSGSGHGGVYFGQGEWVLRQKGWSDLKPQSRSDDSTTGSSSTGRPATVSGPNKVLYEYLGEPVEPPADMDAAYSKAGLIKAVETAARNAGVTVKRIEIEDSEFPFLVGLVCKEGDTQKVTDEIRKMPAYSYNGSSSTPTHSAFNIVPYRAYPPEDGERIGHRHGLRSQVFLSRMLAEH